MSTKNFILSLLAGISILSATALGQTSNGKVAVLNYSAVIRQSSAGKKLFAEFEQKVNAKRTEFEQKTNEISTLQRQLVEQGSLAESRCPAGPDQEYRIQEHPAEA